MALHVQSLKGSAMHNVLASVPFGMHASHRLCSRQSFLPEPSVPDNMVRIEIEILCGQKALASWSLEFPGMHRVQTPTLTHMPE